MTREEAKVDLMLAQADIFYRPKDDSIEMAIKALKQEPCEDVISRQAVLDEINKIGVKGFKTYNDYSQLYDFVDTLPPVTPQPKTGHCKDCDRWKQGKTENNEDWYSDEGFCDNWRTMTGEDFYCGDFEVKEKQK